MKKLGIDCLEDGVYNREGLSTGLELLRNRLEWALRCVASVAYRSPSTVLATNQMKQSALYVALSSFWRRRVETALARSFEVVSYNSSGKSSLDINGGSAINKSSAVDDRELGGTVDDALMMDVAAFGGENVSSKTGVETSDNRSSCSHDHGGSNNSCFIHDTEFASATKNKAAEEEESCPPGISNHSGSAKNHTPNIKYCPDAMSRIIQGAFSELYCDLLGPVCTALRGSSPRRTTEGGGGELQLADIEVVAWDGAHDSTENLCGGKSADNQDRTSSQAERNWIGGVQQPERI